MTQSQVMVIPSLTSGLLELCVYSAHRLLVQVGFCRLRLLRTHSNFCSGEKMHSEGAMVIGQH